MRILRVKNFERFQHYKDRSPPWIKLYNELLDDYEFGNLPDASKWHLIGIWLIASRTDNKIPWDAAWIAKKINTSSEIDLDLLAHSGLIIESDGDDDAPAGKRETWPSRHIPDDVRAEVLERDGHACVKCGDTENIELDHIKPVSKQGKSIALNLQVLCRSCNRRKRTETKRYASA